MSAPFDPSKLNLDINSEDTPELKSQTEASLQARIQENAIDTKIDKSKDSGDILNNVEANPELVVQQAEEKKIVEQKAPSKKPESKPEKAQEEKKPLVKEAKKLIDINIANLDDIITLIDEKSYDYVIVEPEDVQVKITFKQDNVDREVKYVKFPVYTSILFKTKQVAGLVMDDTGNPQE
jgi:hypothetical protein